MNQYYPWNYLQQYQQQPIVYYVQPVQPPDPRIEELIRQVASLEQRTDRFYREMLNTMAGIERRMKQIADKIGVELA